MSVFKFTSSVLNVLRTESLGTAFVCLATLVGCSAGEASVVNQSDEPKFSKTQELQFHSIEHVDGANTQILTYASYSRQSKFSSGSNGLNAQNLLFLNGPDKVAHWLFKDRPQNILHVKQLHVEIEGDHKPSPTLATAIEYRAVVDTALSDSESNVEFRVGLAKPDGTGFKTVIANARQVLAYEIADGKTIAILYLAASEQGRANSLRLAKVTTSTLELLSNKLIATDPTPSP